MSVVLAPALANIFASKADVLVDPVDATGAQGAGLAKAFARLFPDACRKYREFARTGLVHGGDLRVYDDAPSGQRVFFAVTKEHWRRESLLDYIEQIAAAIVDEARAGVVLGKWRSIAIPALGCGFGNLPWGVVAPVLTSCAWQVSDLGGDVYLYQPWAS